jgi:hypothetical protein
MSKRIFVAAIAAFALVAASVPASAKGNGGAIAAGIVGGIALGALAASAANANRVYPPPPPPPRPVPYVGGETTQMAIEACRQGLLGVARQHGAYDAELDDVAYVQATQGGGHRLQAEVTLFYPRMQRESDVVCVTRNGRLISAKTIN